MNDSRRCAVCGRENPGSKAVSVAWLCPDDFEAWWRSGERRRCVEQGALHRNLMDFITRRKAEALNGVKVLA